jgi:hypothetical protein
MCSPAQFPHLWTRWPITGDVRMIGRQLFAIEWTPHSMVTASLHMLQMLHLSLILLNKLA